MQISLLDRRRLEAETLTAVYNDMLRLQGPEHALEFVTSTVSAMGQEAGRAFAAKAPEGPSLEHFSGMVDIWRGTGALDIRNIQREPNSLAFEVHGCAYVDLYRELDLPVSLIPVLSCLRDGPFARGYSPKLSFSRQQTIGGGAPFCDFLFQWED